jgi:glycine cleavage system aminomethyltransferase T
VSTPPAIRSIPAAYDAGEQAEYAAIRSGCAIDRIAPRALVEVAGDEGVRALLRALRFRLFDPGPGEVRAAVVLAGERLTATATVVRRAPDRLLVDCSNPTAERVLEDAGIELLSHEGQLVRMRLRGPALAAVLGSEAPATGVLRTDLAPGGSSTLLCGTGPDRATIYCGRDGARACWDALVAAGALPVGSTALETVRIEDAEPCLERDFPQPVHLALAAPGALIDVDAGERVLAGAVTRRAALPSGSAAPNY